MPFELRPEPHPTLRPEGDYLQRAWSQSVYPLARQMGVPITLPPVSPQPHTHLAFEGYQYSRAEGTCHCPKAAVRTEDRRHGNHAAEARQGPRTQEDRQ